MGNSFDSDNDGMIEEENGPEDKIECVALDENPGKIIKVNSGDADTDTIPDYVDFEIKNEDFEENVFTEIRLLLSEVVELENSLIRVTYNDSDPMRINEESQTPARGKLRLWLKPSNEIRNPKSVLDGGDFIPRTGSKEASWIPADKIFTNGEHEVILWLEAVDTVDSIVQDYPTAIVNFRVLPSEDYDANFLLVDEVRVNPIEMQFVVPGKDGAIVATDYISACTPRPQVFLNDILSEDIEIKKEHALVKLSGYILDPLADNLPDGVGEIESVQIVLNGENYESPKLISSIPSDIEADFWKQHPYKGEFNNLNVKVPLVEGTHTIQVKTSENMAGFTGFDELQVKLSFEKEVEDEPEPNILTVNLYMENEPEVGALDSIHYYLGERNPSETDPVYSERVEDSLTFFGEFGDYEAQINISSFEGLDDSKVDTILADIPLTVIDEQIGYLSAILTETKKNSKIFRAQLDLNIFNSTKYVWRIENIVNEEGSVSNWIPSAVRVRGIFSKPGEDYVVNLGDENSHFKLFEYEGWHYVQNEVMESSSPVAAAKRKLKESTKSKNKLFAVILKSKEVKDKFIPIGLDETGEKLLMKLRGEILKGELKNVKDLRKKLLEKDINAYVFELLSLHSKKNDKKPRKRFVYDDLSEIAGLKVYIKGRIFPKPKSSKFIIKIFEKSVLGVRKIDDSHKNAKDARVVTKWEHADKKNRLMGKISSNNYNYQSGEFVTYLEIKGMPKDSSFFGLNKIVLASQLGYNGIKINFADRRDFYLFYDRYSNYRTRAGGVNADSVYLNKKNILSKELYHANWFYYWSEKRKGPCEYIYTLPETKKHDPIIGYSKQFNNLVSHAEKFDPHGMWDWFDWNDKTKGSIVFFNSAAKYYEKKFKKGDNIFNNGNEMESWNFKNSKITMQANFEAKYDIGPNFNDTPSVFVPAAVNITYNHEATHDKCHKSINDYNDKDNDKVPDDWERKLGMSTEPYKTYGYESYPQFQGSKPNRNRDQELYAWLCGCFDFGKLIIRKNGKKVKPIIYNGVKAKKVDHEKDWSEGGYNWIKQGEVK